MDETDNLLACPFCGSNEVSESSGRNGDNTPFYYVECEKCAGMGPGHIKPRLAVEAWNVRAGAPEHGATQGSRLAPAGGWAHPEAWCEECGQANVCWFTPSPIWNAIVRKAEGKDVMLCPACFIRRAEKLGYTREAWQIQPEFYREDAPIDGGERQIPAR